RLRLEHFAAQPYSRDVRELLLRVGSEPTHGPRQLSLLHRVLGETFANAARQVVEQGRVSWQQVLCIGFSGQTVWHDTEGRFPSTLSLGMAGVVAERTGVTTVSDFRSRDVLVGGQGYPLTALIDSLLFRHSHEQRVLLHLGGTATLLALPPEPGERHLIGFQAAPCTLLLDGLMRLLTNAKEAFDAGGKHAVQGCCIE